MASFLMSGVSGQRILLLLGGMIAATMVGCADLDILPSWVPFQGPASDQVPGVVTPAQRIAELRQLSEKAAASDADERQRVAGQLVAAIRIESDPLIRREIIRSLGAYSNREADAVLKAALTDADTHVRVIACEAWAQRADATAVELLSETLRSDVEADVRLAAAKALGRCKSHEAVTALGEVLADSDPAMQYRAVLSLREATGKDLGNDVHRWQAYVKGELPEPTPTLAERFRRLF
jgi:HEAT repeat protein